ncbi:MAG: LacI family transcriptional regulator [Bacilli bacterium]|jgi:LacI family transcriptional regulator|nr:LacI family transcriptional regulator [Bacilli bacterium]
MKKTVSPVSSKKQEKSRLIDIATKVGVAKSTVSNVFSGAKKVSPSITEKVLDAAKALSYTPDFYAGALSKPNRLTHIIGLFLYVRENQYLHFFRDVSQSCITEAFAFGYNVLVYFGVSADEIVSHLSSGSSPIDGAILLNPQISEAKVKRLSDNCIPCVCIGNPHFKAHNPNFSFVDSEIINITKNVAKAMVKAGFGKIALINVSDIVSVGRDRDDAFKAASEEYHFEGRISNLAMPRDIEEGRIEALKLLDQEYRAFIVGSGDHAYSVYKAAGERNLQVGKDVAVFALGGTNNPKLVFRPKLSYVKQNYTSMTKQATDILVRLINRKKAKDGYYQNPRIVRGDSFVFRNEINRFRSKE